jgi:hypothetical protein
MRPTVPTHGWAVGLNIRVDHRSFERRGIEDVPTIHLGPKAAAMERRQPGSSEPR